MKSEIFKRLSPLAISGAAAFIIGLLASPSALAQCLNTHFSKISQKVFRQQRIFFEGIEELTGDNLPDAYGYQLVGGGFQNLVVVPNLGGGNFGNPIISNSSNPIDNFTFITGNQFYGAIEAGKINNDSAKDIVLYANYSPKAVFSFINNGSGGFTQQAAPTILNPNERVFQIADLNNDGRGDLVTVNFNNPGVTDTTSINAINYRLGNTDGSFGAAVVLYSTNNFVYAYPVVADFNNDGKIDILYGYINSINSGGDNGFYVRTFINVGSGLFSPGAPQRYDFFLPLGAADFNGDNLPDLYSAGNALINTGTAFNLISLPIFNPIDDVPVYSEFRVFAADYNGDGFRDIIVDGERKNFPGNMWSRFITAHINNGAGVFTSNNFRKAFNGEAIDIDADNKIDEVILDSSTTGLPRFTTTNEAAIVVKKGACIPNLPGQTKIADFDGDQSSDILSWIPGNGNWAANSATKLLFNFGGASFGDIPAPGDFDGDGRSDAAVFRNPTGTWWYQRTSSIGNFYGVQFGSPGDIPVAADYDGDGKTDIAVFRPSLGDWYVLRSSDQQFYGFHFGTTGDKPYPQDYDGDGKADFAVYRPNGGNWYIWKSGDNSFFSVQFGISTDIPMPADYDMDGKADVTVYRSANNAWYILRSFDFNYDVVLFGNPALTPLNFDSNGDGIMEVGAHDPQSNLIYAGAQNLFNYGSTLHGERPPNAVYGQPIRVMLPN